MSKEKDLEEPPSHGSLPSVHEAIQTEFVVGINLLWHDIEGSLGGTVHSEVLLCIVD